MKIREFNDLCRLNIDTCHICSYYWDDGEIRKVPGSKSDIFQDRNLAPSSKRFLMRFLKSTLEAMHDLGPLKVFNFDMTRKYFTARLSFSFQLHGPINSLRSFEYKKAVTAISNGASTYVLCYIIDKLKH